MKQVLRAITNFLVFENNKKKDSKAFMLEVERTRVERNSSAFF